MSDHLALMRARTSRHRGFYLNSPDKNRSVPLARMQRTECLKAGVCMSITPYLDEFDADPETKRVLAVALEMTRVSLRLTDDLADGIIAKQIVEVAKTGERNPDLLSEAALKKLHQHLYSD